MPDEVKKESIVKFAIHSIFKSLRIRKFRNGSNFKDGLRLTDKSNVGVIFPFERTHEELAEGVQTVLGYQYNQKIFNFWIPRRFRIKENIFFRKFVRYDSNKVIRTNTILPLLRIKKSTFLKTISKNYLFDYTLVLQKLFPKFDDYKEWNISRAVMNFENFIIDWVKFIIKSPLINDEILNVNTFMVGGGVSYWY